MLTLDAEFEAAGEDVAASQPDALSSTMVCVGADSSWSILPARSCKRVVVFIIAEKAMAGEEKNEYGRCGKD